MLGHEILLARCECMYRVRRAHEHLLPPSLSKARLDSPAAICPAALEGISIGWLDIVPVHRRRGCRCQVRTESLRGLGGSLGGG